MRLHSEEGSSLLEFVISSTVFMLTLFGAISGGLTVYRYSMIANLAQEGARWGIVRGSTSDTNKKAEGTQSGMQTYLQGRSVGVPITVTTSANPASLAPGATLSVTVTSAAMPSTRYMPWNFTISATNRMRMAR